MPPPDESIDWKWSACIVGIIMSLIAKSCSNTACSVRLFLSYLKDTLISVATVWWTKWQESSGSYKWAVLLFLIGYQNIPCVVSSIYLLC